MFERPEALLLLGFIPVWILWWRGRRPHRLRVGGLEPFQQTGSGASPRHTWPLSLGPGLAALLSATLALAGPRGGTPEPWILLDASWSHLGPGQGKGAPHGNFAEADLILGGPDEFLDGELLQAELLLAPARSWIVRTDLPAPSGLPTHIQWQQTPRQGRNAAILAVTPSPGGPVLHWLRVGFSGPWGLQMDDQRLTLPHQGERGEFRLPDRPFAQLRFLQADGSVWQDDQPWDDAWRSPPQLQLPAEADAAWPAAVRAWTAGARIQSLAGTPDLSSAWSLVLETDPFAELPVAEALAEARLLLEPWIALGDQPRWESECRPAAASSPWPVGLPIQTPPADPSLPRKLVWIALILGCCSGLLRWRGR